MTTHRLTGHRTDPVNHTDSPVRALAILVLAAFLAVGTAGVVLTGSVTSGILFGLLTGGCIVLAHLMIAPGPDI
jgi:hypothetical protein